MFPFKAFLSHRYKSPEVNLYFFNLFSKLAEVQFEIDDGTFSTNVTRLERMVRNADAFVGIYPFPGSLEEALNPEELKKQSRYFRLEMDLCLRSQKPAVVFYDKRYRDILFPPPGVFSESFDFFEIAGPGGFPNLKKHEREFLNFCKAVKARKEYEDIVINKERTTIGLFIPENNENEAGYNHDCIEKIKSILQKFAYSDIIQIKLPASLDNKLIGLLDRIDIAITDIGHPMASIPAYLHGRFVPTIRLHYNPDNASAPADQFLFAGVEVGYNKDIISWDTLASLEEGFSQRLATINANVKRINTKEEAREYFQSAALRKEIVFLSYSGKDIETANKISNSLKQKFQKVFDYKDGESIQPGTPWLDSIFDQLSASAIGLPLLTESYFNSKNCMHELRQMVAKNDNGELQLLPVKLYKELLTLPSFLESTQYIRFSDHKNAHELVQKIISSLSKK